MLINGCLNGGASRGRRTPARRAEPFVVTSGWPDRWRGGSLYRAGPASISARRDGWIPRMSCTAPSSRGLGRRPLKAVTPVRIRSGLQLQNCRPGTQFSVPRALRQGSQAPRHVDDHPRYRGNKFVPAEEPRYPAGCGCFRPGGSRGLCARLAHQVHLPPEVLLHLGRGRRFRAKAPRHRGRSRRHHRPRVTRPLLPAPRALVQAAGPEESPMRAVRSVRRCTQ